MSLKEKLNKLSQDNTGLKECQVEFDRYLRLYTDKSMLKKR